MALTANSSQASARRKFFINSRRKFFMNSTYIGTSCLESKNQTFLGSGDRNESNSHQLARIGENKIFHELHVHHV